MSQHLSAIQLDRAAGVLLGQGCGDALGVPYEFQRRLTDEEQPQMIGGGLGPYEPGEYSDDTQMAVCIAEVAATGADLRTPEALDAIAANFEKWYAEGATDIGTQTRHVLHAAAMLTGSAATRLHQAAADLHAQTGRTAGNGALMRTSPVALAHLGDDDAIAEAARGIAELTHTDPLAGDSCVLWCIAIDRAICEGRVDGIRDGLDLLPAERRGQWSEWIDEAEAHAPAHFSPNVFTVRALQAAWSAVMRTPIPDHLPAGGSFDCQHFEHALAAAVRAGNDTDTVAAIAGGLLGARWGASAVPFGWRRILHGWPALRVRDLQRLAVLAVRGGKDDSAGWPSGDVLDYKRWVPQPVPVIPHPHDPKVLLDTANCAGADEANAVVSLCRLGAAEVPRRGVAPEDHIEVWLIDSDNANAHQEFVVDQAARAVAALRDEGKTVLLHCVAAEMRTPAVAARYAVLRGMPVDQALADVTSALPNARTGGALGEAVRRLGPS